MVTNWTEKKERFIPDVYDRNARLYPMLLLLLPVLLTFWVIVPEKLYNWEAIAGLAGWCGLALLLKELGRSGKKKENELWKNWGGAPSTQYLRHHGQTNKTTVKRIHAKLQQIIPEIDMPTADFEAAQPEKADEVYEECTRVMRDRTRNKERFPLIFKELCSYGFWRNLWGLKGWGLWITGLCFLVNTAAIYYHLRVDHILESYDLVISEILNFALVVFWINLNESKIKISAFAYAERLFEATESLESKAE